MSASRYEGAEGERRVLEYLREHPMLLVEHPEILADMRIPHACGKAVSLVEHQVAVLRDQNRRLKRRLRELIDNARHNQQGVQRLLALALSLFECRAIGEVIERLYQALGEDFEIDVATMRLFAAPPPNGDRRLREFTERDERVLQLFEHILAGGRPICGRLKPAQLEFLFGERRAEIGSSAILPLGEAGRIGLLAIASRDPQRFHPAQGTEFLSHVGDLVTRAIRPHLAAA